MTQYKSLISKMVRQEVLVDVDVSAEKGGLFVHKRVSRTDGQGLYVVAHKASGRALTSVDSFVDAKNIMESVGDLFDWSKSYEDIQAEKGLAKKVNAAIKGVWNE